ncbi:MAG TPA: glycosyltransferase family 39 protein, partial [bacterium]|nr:glycosyltransferase family 39 protein [bacterium]
MKSWAETAVPRPDSKTRTLITWLKKIVKPNGQWSDERVIIFTEYRDTQKWLMEMLALEGLTGNGRLLTLYGGMDSPSREKIKAAFQADPAASPVRILLATDAASEGIDLQKHCHRLVHFEISWNPNRMEQRNGRIDRHGQRASEVLIFHFVGQGYQNRSWNAATDPHGNDLEADLEFLLHAALKVENIRNDLGKVGPVIAEQVEQAMLGQRSRQLDTAAAEQAAKRAGALLKFERDVKRDLERIAEQLDETKRELRLSPENIQHVVQIALELAGQPPLREVIVPGIWPDPQRRRTECPVFHLPPLRGSWAACAEGLADPHSGKIRPIVFDPFLIEWRDDVVLCHLNHRLAQMSLREITARTAADIQPPAYYYLLHAWMTLFGRSEVAVRLLSVVFGVLTVPLAYLLARRMLSPAVGVTTALLVAVSPFHIWYAQETRMYTLVTALGVASSWLLAKLVDAAGRTARPTDASPAGLHARQVGALAAAWAAVNIVAVYTHYYAFFLVAFQAMYLAMVWAQRGRPRPLA